MKLKFQTLLFILALTTTLYSCSGGSGDDTATQPKDNTGTTDPKPPTGEGGTSKATYFYTRACVMDFTATWCPYCPQLMRGLESASESYPDRIVTIAIHSSSSDLYSGNSDLTKLMDTYGIDGFPSGLYNFRAQLESRAASFIVYTLKSEITTHHSTIGIGVVTKINDKNGVDVTVNLKSGSKNDYRVAMFLVEDDITHKQVDGGSYNNNFVHKNIPLAVYPNPTGTDLGTLDAGAEKTLTHTFTNEELLRVDSRFKGQTTIMDYNKCRVVVYATKKAGTSYYIDNVISCGAKNSKADYKAE